jgi:hypothetical protein
MPRQASVDHHADREAVRQHDRLGATIATAREQFEREPEGRF